MKRSILTVLAFGLFFLFFIQMAGMLVESIYILDLMHTSLDAKVLGVLFFFTPVLLLPFRKKFPGWVIWTIFISMILSRCVTPYLTTLGRLFSSGIGTGTALLLFPLLLTAKAKGEFRQQTGLQAAAGLSLAVGLSVLLRTLDYSLDYSLTPSGAWAGWLLGLVCGWALTRLDWEGDYASQPDKRGVTSAIFGVFLVLALVYFAFSAPAVIARWTEGNYVLIVGAVSLFSTGWVFLSLRYPALLERIPRRWLVCWNLLFTLCLTGTILAQCVSFPLTPAAPAVVVQTPTWIQQIPLVLMLLLFPVIFLDMRLFFKQIHQANPTPRSLIPGTLLGSMVLVVLVFITIFTNVWGYIAPVSTPFRNAFYLPFFLITGVISLLGWWLKPAEANPGQTVGGESFLGWAVLLGVIFLATGFSALRMEVPRPADPAKTSLLVMTYNIQAGNDGYGERSYDRQLALIRRISPDIVALQESDTARIALNNDDYVRYFAGKLGYYSYYGPTTVTGTFGTAILSKYPLRNTRSVFSFSDTDEIGTAEAEIEAGGRSFTVYDVHPDGSDTAKLTLAHSLLERSAGEVNVIALGDFNLRDTDEAYKIIAAKLTEAWSSVNPSKVGEGWIDHIFFSPGLGVRNPTYLMPPDSASDHPVHWAEIFWEK